jgi:HupE / UreJ protein
MCNRLNVFCLSLAFGLVLVTALPLGAHEIPSDVTLQVFLKPQGHTLNALVRVPLKAMRDINFPERGPGYLDIDATKPLLADAATLWVSNFMQIYEGDVLLPGPKVTATQISLESDRSFLSYDHALAHIEGPSLPEETEIYWNQPELDVRFEYPIQSDQSRFSVDADGLWRLGQRTTVVMRFVEPNGAIRAFEFNEAPQLVRMDPEWYQAGLHFVRMGFEHILDGTDHLLFLFCLVIPFRRFRSLIPIVTSFTVAHSITLIASAYNLAPDELWFPPLIETLIAVSIVYMALENIVGGSTVNRRWMITFGFGLVHGFGFSFALRQTLQFAGNHMLSSLLAFNIGVEVGQLVVLLLLIPAVDLLFRFVVAERMGTIILSAIIAHTAWHWMLDRYAILSRYTIQLPTLTDAGMATLLQWLMVLIAAGGGIWFVRQARRNRGLRSGASAPALLGTEVVPGHPKEHSEP